MDTTLDCLPVTLSALITSVWLLFGGTDALSRICIFDSDDYIALILLANSSLLTRRFSSLLTDESAE
jgi:hypothetical protein